MGWNKRIRRGLNKRRKIWKRSAGLPAETMIRRRPGDILICSKRARPWRRVRDIRGRHRPLPLVSKSSRIPYWKLCFDSHAVQMEWLAALTDAIVNASVDSYNANLLLAADPNHEATMFESEYLPPPGSRDAGTQLWMMGTYRVSSVGADEGHGQETNVMETETGIEVISTSSLRAGYRWKCCGPMDSSRARCSEFIDYCQCCTHFVTSVTVKPTVLLVHFDVLQHGSWLLLGAGVQEAIDCECSCSRSFGSPFKRPCCCERGDYNRRR